MNTPRLTPETNEADTIPYMDGNELTWWVKKDFARTLERERDEARRYAEEWRRHCLKRHVVSQIVSSKLPWEEEP